MVGKILIAGASGNIGAALVDELRYNADFAVLRSTLENRKDEAEVRSARFEDPEGLEKAFAGIATLFVVLPLVPDKLQFAQHIACAARKAGIRHIVRSSAAGADSRSSYSLLRLQGAIDDVFAGTGIATTFLRPAGFMQNLSGYLATQLRAGALYAPHGTGAQSLIDVGDIAAAAAAILRDPVPHAGRTYTLTGAAALTDAEIVDQISATVGKSIRYIDVPEETARDALLQIGTPALLVEWLMSLNLVIKANLAAEITNDVHLLTGHRPRAFSDFVLEHASAWR